jgi:hypothetical protein
MIRATARLELVVDSRNDYKFKCYFLEEQMKESKNLLKSNEFQSIWKTEARKAANTIVRKLFDSSDGASTRAYHKKNKNGGSFWLEIRSPNDRIQLIDFELQEDVAPLTLRLRIWFYNNAEGRAKKIISAGPAMLADEIVNCYEVYPSHSWQTQLTEKGISIEGIEYPIRETEFLQSEVSIEPTLENILLEMYRWIESVDQGTAKINHTLFPNEVDTLTARFQEGAIKRVFVNKYERNQKARDACIEHYKAICAVCAFDFSVVYGDIGKGFIHVHHKVDLSSIGGNYIVDPVKDLIPVCPNCHAMLHQRNPAFTVEEIRQRIKA